MLFSDWLTVIVVGWIVIITPGPNMAIVFRNSLVYSPQAGVATAAGLVAGNLVHITYCLVGIGVLISQSVALFNIVKLVGAIYLIYLGVKTLRTQPQITSTHEHASSNLSTMAAIRTGFLTDLLNPKATLFFLALFTQIIRPETSIPVRLGYGFTIVALEFICLSILACVIGQPIIRRKFNAVSHWIERATGVVLIGLGLRIAFARASH